MRLYRLKKEERLSGKKRIEELFREGSSFFYSPFRVLWKFRGDGHPAVPDARIAIAVSRRNFKKAVHRNLIKRRIREAYRKNKSVLTKWLREKMLTVDVVFVYTGSQILSYRDIEEKIIITLRKIIEENEKGTD